MIPPIDQIDLLFVIAPHALLLDIAGPAEAFRLANYHRSIRGLPHRFRLRFAGPAIPGHRPPSAWPSPISSLCPPS